MLLTAGRHTIYREIQMWTHDTLVQELGLDLYKATVVLILAGSPPLLLSIAIVGYSIGAM